MAGVLVSQAGLWLLVASTASQAPPVQLRAPASLQAAGTRFPAPRWGAGHLEWGGREAEAALWEKMRVL